MRGITQENDAETDGSTVILPGANANIHVKTLHVDLDFVMGGKNPSQMPPVVLLPFFPELLDGGGFSPMASATLCTTCLREKSSTGRDVTGPRQLGHVYLGVDGRRARRMSTICLELRNVGVRATWSRM
jgi:hypothetical protein